MVPHGAGITYQPGFDLDALVVDRMLPDTSSKPKNFHVKLNNQLFGFDEIQQK